MSHIDVVLLPGIDSIQDKADRERIYRLPEVQRAIDRAQKVLDDNGAELDLTSVMIGPSELSLAWMSGLVVCTSAAQVGLFEHYKECGGRTDLLMGVSLGDVARAHCAGVVGFEAMVQGIWEFSELVQPKLGIGGTLQVRSRGPLQIEQLGLEAHNLTPCVYQRDDSLLITGSVEQLGAWRAEHGDNEHFSIRDPYPIPIPLHSPLLDDVAEVLGPRIAEQARFEACRIEMYSTLLERPIASKEDLIADATMNINSPVRFAQSAKRLVSERKDAIRFVNLGPAPTLAWFLEGVEFDTDAVDVVSPFGRMESQTVGMPA